MRRTLIPLLALAAVLVGVAPAAAKSGVAVTIRHQSKGCHSWSVNGGPYKASQTIHVKAGTLAPEIYEVTMTLRADAKQGSDSVFMAELVYGAVVTLANTPPEDVSTALMVETPRLLFPFARSILAEVTRDGGFTPLLLNPIDFNEIYARRAATPPEGGTATV